MSDPPASSTLQGRRVLIVGASAGIGRAVALAASALGAEVAVTGRRVDRLEELVKDMGGGMAFAAELRDPSQCEALVDAAAGRLGPMDALVFAASTSPLALTRDADADVWRSVLETNVMAPALVTRRLLAHLAPGAFLGYMSSEIVGQPYHGLGHYATSKAALEELVRSLRVEHPEYRFCCIRVGATGDTEFARDFSPELSAELFPHWVSRAKLPASLMVSADVGKAVGQLLVTVLSTPGVDVQDFTIRPPGGPFVGGVGDLVEGVKGKTGS